MGRKSKVTKSSSANVSDIGWVLVIPNLFPHVQALLQHLRDGIPLPPATKTAAITALTAFLTSRSSQSGLAAFAREMNMLPKRGRKSAGWTLTKKGCRHALEVAVLRSKGVKVTLAIAQVAGKCKPPIDERTVRASWTKYRQSAQAEILARQFRTQSLSGKAGDLIVTGGCDPF